MLRSRPSTRISGHRNLLAYQDHLDLELDQVVDYWSYCTFDAPPDIVECKI
jgi:hypothetical protein